MRIRLVIAAGVATVVALGSASASAGTPKGGLVAFRDSNAAPTEASLKTSVLTLLKLQCSGIALPSAAGARAAQQLPPGVTLPPGVKLPPGITIPGAKKPRKQRKPTFAQALASAERVAAGRGVAKVLTKLRSGKQLRKEAGALQVTQAAVLAGSPRLALGALLTAHKRDPRDRMDLVDAAVPLAILGQPDDALALLEQAERMRGPLPEVGGIPGAAVLRNNIGFAEQKLGQNDKAIASFTRALSAAPELSEANTNLGAALACKGNGDAAVHRIHESLARQTLKRIDAKAAGSTAPISPLLPQIPIAGVVLDLSAGPEGTLPPVPIPSTPGAAVAAQPVLGALSAEVGASISALSTQREQADARAKAAKAPNTATTLRRSSIANLVNTSYDEPEIGPLYDQALAAFQEVGAFTSDFWAGKVPAKQRECNAAGSPLETCFIPWCQGAFSSAMGGYRSRMGDLDAAMRSYWKLAGPREVGAAANIGDPAWHELSMLDARAHAAANYNLLISAQLGWMGSAKFFEPLCVAGKEPPPPETGAAPALTDPGGCSGSLAKDLSGTLSTDVDVGPEKSVSVSLTVACDKVEVELSHGVAGTGDLLSVFGKGEADLKQDTVTMVAGVSGDAVGLASGQSGFYVTTGKSGIEDFGWRVGGGGAANPFGGFGSGSENISLVGSIDYIPTAFGFGGK